MKLNVEHGIVIGAFATVFILIIVAGMMLSLDTIHPEFKVTDRKGFEYNCQRTLQGKIPIEKIECFEEGENLTMSR